MAQFETLNLEGVEFDPENADGVNGIRNVLRERLAPKDYQIERDKKQLDATLYAGADQAERTSQFTQLHFGLDEEVPSSQGDLPEIDVSTWVVEEEEGGGE